MRKKFLCSVLALSLLTTSVFNFSTYSYKLNSVSAEEKLDSLKDKVLVSGYSSTDLVKVIVKLKEDSINPEILNSQAEILKREKETEIVREKALDVFSKSGIEYKKLMEYSLLFNGFALEIFYGDFGKLKSLDIVEDVNLNAEYKKPTAEQLKNVNRGSSGFRKKRDLSFNEIINVSPLWNNNVKGQGMVVSVIDSGIDTEHNIFRISDVSTAKYKNSEEIEAVKEKVGITYGGWINEKIVFGYNYNDLNMELKEKTESSHGTHVAGTAVGNPSEPAPTGELIAGVAPEAQLIFMRVFSDVNSGGTSAFIYAKAIEDSVKLGADSINMSIGSTTGTVHEMGSILVNAMELAKRAGVTVSIAGGNDGAFGDGFSTPSAKNPDYGLVADPSVLYESLSVASINNNFIRSEVFNVKELATNKDFNFGKIYMSTPTKDFERNVEYSYEYVGKGKPEDFTGKDLTGKLALIERGEITFADKVKNAKTAKASGVVIFNSVEGGNDVISMNVGDEGNSIAVTSIGNSIGQELVKNPNYTITFAGEMMKLPNSNANMLSNFSSWGLSTDGELKPDITAPGGSIYSSINNGKYETQSGTSMASPHVAGAIALVKQTFKTKYSTISSSDLHNLVKGMLMSTAVPHFNEKNNAYTSPRQQGAGLLNVEKAVSSDIYLTGTNGYPSISLGNVGETFTFDVVIHNLSNEEKSLKYVTNLGTDEVVDGKFTLLPRELSKINGEVVTIAPKSSKTVTVTVDSSAFTNELTGLMPNGYFLEGFVRFLNSTDDVEEVSIPFVGFKGQFQDLPVIEKPIYDFVGEEKPFYYEEDEINYTTFLTEEDNLISGRKGEFILGEYLDTKNPNNLVYRKDKLAFSPGLADKNKDLIAFKATFLRNFRNLNVSIYREDDVERKNPVFNKGNVFGVKSYFGGKSRIQKAVMLPETLWEGKDNFGNPLPEGNYKYVITVRPDVPGAKDQVYEFDIILDNTMPHYTGGIYEEETRTFKPHKPFDAHSGIYKMTVKSGSTEILPNENGHYIIPENINPERVEVVLEDYAGNIDDSFRLINKDSTGEVGVIDIKLMVDNLTEDYSKSLARFKITDEAGNVVAYETFQKAVGYDPLTFEIYWKTLKKFPFGKYKVELVLHHPDLDVLTEKVIDVTLNSDNPYEEVVFKAREIFTNKITIEFDKPVDDSVKVFVLGKNGEKIELTHSKFVKNIFEKEVANGEYTVVIETGENYKVLENNFTMEVKDGRNQKTVEISKVEKTETILDLGIVDDTNPKDNYPKDVVTDKTENKIDNKADSKADNKADNKVNEVKELTENSNTNKSEKTENNKVLKTEKQTKILSKTGYGITNLVQIFVLSLITLVFITFTKRKLKINR